MENFLDILTALVRLLHVYHVRGVVNRHHFVDRLCHYLEVATKGIDTDNDYCEGYLYTLYDNLDGDTRYLQEVCDNLNFLGHIRAVLLIVQRVRFVPGEQGTWGPPAKRPSECLIHTRDKLKNTIRDLSLAEPSNKEVMKALEEYKMFSPAELSEFEREIDS
jgi:hypothetical protein